MLLIVDLIKMDWSRWWERDLVVPFPFRCPPRFDFHFLMICAYMRVVKGVMFCPCKVRGPRVHRRERDPFSLMPRFQAWDLMSKSSRIHWSPDTHASKRAPRTFRTGRAECWWDFLMIVSITECVLRTFAVSVHSEPVFAVGVCLDRVVACGKPAESIAGELELNKLDMSERKMVWAKQEEMMIPWIGVKKVLFLLFWGWSPPKGDGHELEGSYIPIDVWVLLFFTIFNLPCGRLTVTDWRALSSAQKRVRL